MSFFPEAPPYDHTDASGQVKYRGKPESAKVDDDEGVGRFDTLLLSNTLGIFTDFEYRVSQNGRAEYIRQQVEPIE